MEKYGLYILGLLLVLWLLRMSRKYGLLNVFDALAEGCGKYLFAIATVILIVFALYLLGLLR